MSFVKLLTGVAVGVAATKGYSKYKELGGMDGVKDAMRDNPQLKGMSDQAIEMAAKMGLPTDQMEKMRDSFLGQAGAAKEQAEAGMGGLMNALGGGMAGGAVATGAMIDAMTGTTLATDAMEENAKLMIRTMIQAAKSDGEIDAEERAKILDQLNDPTADEIAFIEAEFDAPVDAMSLAADTSEQMAAQVYAAALSTVKVDSLSEAKFLQDLGNALNLSDEVKNRIHASMGVS